MEKKTIGGFIAALRKAGGMTQKELAERLNVSDKTVSRWERDEGVPDLSLVPVIAEIFDVTCDELLRGQRRSPEDRTAEGDAPTARGEKERQRLLAAGLSGYKSRTLVAAGLSLAGMLAAMALNFGFNRAWLGFVAAGLGSALYDLTAGYGAECLITFVSKGAIALVAGLIALGIAHKPETGRADVLRVVIACVAGALTYVALYMLKTFIFGMWVNGLGLDGTLVKMGTKIVGSLINALFASVAGPIVFLALKPALRHAGLMEKM